MMKEAAVMLVLFAAAVRDARVRTIPNAFCVCVLACCLVPPVRFCPLGILAALPLFAAGMTCGGIGGGDIKLILALGAVLGLWTTIYATVIAMALLVAFHGLRRAFGREGASYPLVPFLFAGMAAAGLFG